MKFKTLAIGLALQCGALIAPVPAQANYNCDGVSIASFPPRGDYCRYVATLCESGGTEDPSSFMAEIDCKKENGICPSMNQCHKQLQNKEDVKYICTHFGNDCWQDDIPPKDSLKGYSHK